MQIVALQGGANRVVTEEKRSICLQTTIPGVSVARVEHRYAMNANLIFTWLRDPRYAAAAPAEPDGATSGAQLIDCVADAMYPLARNANFGIFNRVREMSPMTRNQLVEFINGQVDALGLNVPERITVELATRLRFQDLTTDSLDALQLVMALEEATGSDLELDQLRSCPTLLDAIDLIASTAKQPR
jgi:acyl carrier protein